jgi:DNA topoisomerase-1
MRDRHVELSEGAIQFRFRGKSGKDHRVGIFDDDLARLLQECVELEGEELFKYFDEQDNCRIVESDDVNEYLRAVSGYDFTAKDFRTWAGTVRTITVLRELGEAPTQRERKRRMVQAVKFVAADLNNTPATCRAFYIHPAVLAAYEAGRLEELAAGMESTDTPESAGALSPEERLAMALLPRLEAEFGGETGPEDEAA